MVVRGPSRSSSGTWPFPYFSNRYLQVEIATSAVACEGVGVGVGVCVCKCVWGGGGGGSPAASKLHIYRAGDAAKVQGGAISIVSRMSSRDAQRAQRIASHRSHIMQGRCDTIFLWDHCHPHLGAHAGDSSISVSIQQMRSRPWASFQTSPGHGATNEVTPSTTPPSMDKATSS